MDKVADHLTDNYSFSTTTEILSGLKHFKTVIGDVNLHFIHMVGSEEKKGTPILLLHGWPSTIVEFYKTIPILLEKGKIQTLLHHGYNNDFHLRLHCR